MASCTSSGVGILPGEGPLGGVGVWFGLVAGSVGTTGKHTPAHPEHKLQIRSGLRPSFSPDCEQLLDGAVVGLLGGAVSFFMNWEFDAGDFLAMGAALFVVLGVAPVLRGGHGARINLSVWAVITANAWLAALGNLFAEQKGASAVYMLLNALILSPVFFFNIKRGVWGGLPSWHKVAAFILPIGTGVGVIFGGEYATWAAVGVSLLLSTQLIESCWKGISREHILTWTWFILADGSALFFGWKGADVSLKVLLSVWVLQCGLVIAIEGRNRLRGRCLKIRRTEGLRRAA